MNTVIWILIGLLAVIIGYVVIQFQVYKRGLWEQHVVIVDGKSFTIRIRYGSAFPQRLKVHGIAVDTRIWMYFVLAVVSRVRVAHEVVHLVLEFILTQKYGLVIGRLIYKLKTGFERISQRVHNRRGTEEEARRGQGGLAIDGVEDVMVLGKLRHIEALWLLEIKTP